MRNRAMVFPQMLQESNIAVLERSEDSKCYHHWIIDRANGPVSHGICKFCHEERDFSNSPPQYSSRRGYEINSRKTATGLQF